MIDRYFLKENILIEIQVSAPGPTQLDITERTKRITSDERALLLASSTKSVNVCNLLYKQAGRFGQGCTSNP